jgi:hypothetical protein
MYPLILSFEPLTSLSCSLNAVFPGLKIRDTFACATAKKLTHFIISIAVLENVPPDAGLQKGDTFATLNVGLAGTRPPAWQAAALTAQPYAYTFLPLLLPFTELVLWSS